MTHRRPFKSGKSGTHLYLTLVCLYLYPVSVPVFSVCTNVPVLLRMYLFVCTCIPVPWSVSAAIFVRDLSFYHYNSKTLKDIHVNASKSTFTYQSSKYSCLHFVGSSRQLRLFWCCLTSTAGSSGCCGRCLLFCRQLQLLPLDVDCFKWRHVFILLLLLPAQCTKHKMCAPPQRRHTSRRLRRQNTRVAVDFTICLYKFCC